MSDQMGRACRAAAFLLAACLCVPALAQESAPNYSTPEATWNTFLAACRKGDFDAVSRCLTAKERVKFDKQFEGKSEEEIEDLKKQMRDAAAKITNTILATKRISKTSVHLKIRTDFFKDEQKTEKEGDETKWKRFKLEEGEWKVENP